jgi:peptide deformylase
VIRPVLVFPDRRLQAVAAPVRTFGPALGRLAADLAETARHHPRTVGLAATQVGEMWRVVHVDCTGHPRVPGARDPLTLVNPVVVAREGAEIDREGCLSLPEVTANVRRATRITVRARDIAGEPFELTAEGFEARVVLHEIDHLDGVLILDRVASLARDVFPRRSGRGRSRGRSLVNRAETLARLAHAGAVDAAGRPHAARLEATVAVLREAGVEDPELRAAAWLHDATGPGTITSEDLVPEYGERVAALVAALADRTRDGWDRVAATPGAALVALARAVADLTEGAGTWCPGADDVRGADLGPGGAGPAERLRAALRGAGADL